MTGAGACAWSNDVPDNKVHGANMGHTWVVSVPGWPHVGPINIAIKVLKHGFSKVSAYLQWPLLLTWFNFNPSMNK